MARTNFKLDYNHCTKKMCDASKINKDKILNIFHKYRVLKKHSFKQRFYVFFSGPFSPLA